MDRLESSFEAKVRTALHEILGLGLGVLSLEAHIEGKIVTLRGTVSNLEVKTRVMQEFNARVMTDNTLNQIRLVEP